MQIIDVLRDHRRGLSRSVEACYCKMAATGSRGGELRVHGEAPPPRFVAHFLVREELIEWDRLVLRPQPARGAKVGDATLGGNSSAGERRDHAPGFDQLVPLDPCGLP